VYRTKFDNKYFIVYLTTNHINGKIYVGKQCTKNLNDGYLGSGKYFKNAVKKYGRNNFYREILEFCSSKEQLNEREMYWIIELNARDLTIGYNIGRGGEGCQLEHHSIESKRKNSESNKGKPSWCKGLTKETDHRVAKLSQSCKGRPSGMKGKHHTAESKRKSSKSNKGKQAGTKNKFYGKHHTEIENQKIRNIRLNDPIEMCPWCFLICKSPGNMRRWHFDNCRKKPGNENKNVSPSIESNKKRSITLQNKSILTCPYCGTQSRNRGKMKIAHFDNCKLNPVYIDTRQVYVCSYCGFQSKNRGTMVHYHFDNCKCKVKTA